MTCYDSQVIRRMTAFVLDSCGKIPTVGVNATPAIKGLAAGIQSVVKAPQVTQPTQNTIKTINGGSCSKPLASPVDNGYIYTLTFCGANPVFESAIGYTTLVTSGTTITGWDDAKITGQVNIALEIIFEPSASACAGGAAAPCVAMLVPMLQAWVKSSSETYNGSDVPDLVAAGQTRTNANIFANYGSGGALPSTLSHWSTRYAAIAVGDKWAYRQLMTCPTADVQTGCYFSGVNDTT